MPKTSKAQLAATRRYQNKKDRFNILFDFGTRKRIEAVIKGRSYSTVTQFIKEAVYLHLDNEEKYLEIEKHGKIEN